MSTTDGQQMTESSAKKTQTAQSELVVQPNPENTLVAATSASQDLTGTNAKWFTLGQLSDVMLLAVLSFVGYCYVFAFEAGFTSLYHIPWSLISLNLTTGLAAGAALVGGTVSYIYNAPQAVKRVFLNDDKAREYGYYWTGVFVTDAILIWHYNALALLLLNLFGLAVLRPLMKKHVWSKNPQAWAGEASLIDETIFSRLAPRLHLVVALALVGLIVVYAWGRHTAKYEPHLLFTLDHQTYLVLRIYGDTVISAPVKLQNFDGQILWKKFSDKEYVVQRSLRLLKINGTDLPKFDERPSDIAIKQPYSNPLGGFYSWLYPYP